MKDTVSQSSTAPQMHATPYRHQFADFAQEVVALLTEICGNDARDWSTAKFAFDQIQASRTWQDWVGSGLTRDQLVQFVHRLRIKRLNGEPLEVPVSSPLERRASFRVPKGWKILPGPPAAQTRKTKRRIAHRFSGMQPLASCWQVGLRK